MTKRIGAKRLLHRRCALVGPTDATAGGHCLFFYFFLQRQRRTLSFGVTCARDLTLTRHPGPALARCSPATAVRPPNTRRVSMQWVAAMATSAISPGLLFCRPPPMSHNGIPIRNAPPRIAHPWSTTPRRSQGCLSHRAFPEVGVPRGWGVGMTPGLDCCLRLAAPVGLSYLCPFLDPSPSAWPILVSPLPLPFPWQF